MSAPDRSADFAATASPDELLLAALIDNLDLLQSYVVSAREAAWRRSTPFLRLHIYDIGAALADAIGDLQALERLEAGL